MDLENQRRVKALAEKYGPENLVVEMCIRDRHEAAIRLAGLKVAAYLGEAGRNVEPDEVDIYECLPLPEQEMCIRDRDRRLQKSAHRRPLRDRNCPHSGIFPQREDCAQGGMAHNGG